MIQPGLIQVYTGEGKGKTTASLGLAFRALGHGFRVCMIQFMKKFDYGECRAALNFPNFSLLQVGTVDFIRPGSITPEQRAAAAQGWKQALEAIHSGNYDLIILDELSLVMHWKLVDEESILAELRKLKADDKKPEIVITGRYASLELVELADLVTEMRPLQGAAGSPRQGIHY